MKIRAVLFASALAFAPIASLAQSATPVVPGYQSIGSCPGGINPCFRAGNAVLPGGYQQFTVASSTALPSIPTGAFEAMIVCESQTVRWRDDGVAPTASVGMPLVANQPFPYMGTAASLAAFRIIETTPSATCNVSYYK